MGLNGEYRKGALVGARSALLDVLMDQDRPDITGFIISSLFLNTLVNTHRPFQGTLDDLTHGVLFRTDSEMSFSFNVSCLLGLNQYCFTAAPLFGCSCFHDSLFPPDGLIPS